MNRIVGFGLGGAKTNIVFWFLVIVVLAAIWFFMSAFFKEFGEFFTGLFDDAKKGMSDEEQSSENEEDEL